MTVQMILKSKKQNYYFNSINHMISWTFYLDLKLWKAESSLKVTMFLFDK